MTLKQILDYGNSLERTDQHAKQLEDVTKRNTVNCNERRGSRTLKCGYERRQTAPSGYNNQNKKFPKHPST